MTGDRTEAAAGLLWRNWQGGTRIAELPADVRPQSRAEGYAVQAELEARSAKPLYGWKIAATSAGGQTHIGVDGPLAGRLLAERVLDSGAAVPFGTNHMKVAEAEFAFRVGRTLQPRSEPYSVDEVLAAVDTLHLTIEIPDSRYDEFAKVGAPQLIADDACAHWLVVGEAVEVDWRALDLAAHPVVATVSSDRHETLQREGRGSNVLGDPRIALAWLANELSSLAIPLRAGELVTTGTCVVPVAIAPGDAVQADFGALGSVECRIT